MNLFNALKATAQSAKSYVDKKITEVYHVMNNYHSEAFIIPEGITQITHEYVSDNIGYDVQTVVIPKSATEIGSEAFAYKSALKSVVFSGSNVTKIGDKAFWLCSNLESLAIPDSVTYIGESILLQCSNLKRLSVPFIGKNSFSNKVSYLFGGVPTQLEYLTITGNFDIYQGAFQGCKSLKTVTITGNCTSIHSSAFSGCSSLENIVIPATVTSIGGSAFYGCKKLTDIDISNVASLESHAFWGCEALKNIQLNESLPVIPAYAFQNCVNLTEVVIPDSVNVILDYAFSNCYRLYRVTLGEGIQDAGAVDCFKNCYRLVEVYNLSMVELSLEDNTTLGGIAAHAINIPTTESELGTFGYSNDCVFYTLPSRTIYMIDYIGDSNVLTLQGAFDGTNGGLANYHLNSYALYGTYITTLDTSTYCKVLDEYSLYSAVTLYTLVIGPNIDTIEANAVPPNSGILGAEFYDTAEWFLDNGSNEFTWVPSRDIAKDAVDLKNYCGYRWEKQS